MTLRSRDRLSLFAEQGESRSSTAQARSAIYSTTYPVTVSNSLKGNGTDLTLATSDHSLSPETDRSPRSPQPTRLVLSLTNISSSSNLRSLHPTKLLLSLEY
eukprot:2244242-Rhodomonas_salina.1